MPTLISDRLSVKVATVLRAYTYLGQTKRNDDDFINIITDADAPLE